MHAGFIDPGWILRIAGIGRPFHRLGLLSKTIQTCLIRRDKSTGAAMLAAQRRTRETFT
jgi:hypothetical protein